MADSSSGSGTGPDPPTRVCVLADATLKRWQVWALEELEASTDVEISPVVVNHGRAPSSTGSYGKASPGGDTIVSMTNSGSFGLDDIGHFLRSLRADGAWALMLAMRKLTWVLGDGCPEWNRAVPVGEVTCLRRAETIRCAPLRSGQWNELPDDVVDTITDRADVAIRFGFGLIRGRLLDELPYGVLSYHPADIERYRGLGPTEMFLNGDRTGGVTLQQLTDSIDGGNVIDIAEIDLSGAYTLEEVRARIYQAHVPMLASGIQRLREPDFEPSSPDEMGDYHALEELRRVRYVGRLIGKDIAGRIRRRWDRQPVTTRPPSQRNEPGPRPR